MKYYSNPSELDQDSMWQAYKTGRSDANIGQVKAFTEQHPTSSLRKVASASDLSIPTVYRILKEELHMKHYKPWVNRQLSEYDFVKRLAFRQRVKEMIDRDSLDLNKIIF